MKIIRDTREKNGWDFSNHEHCSGMIYSKLDYGDYAIEGMETKVCIERKASPSELSMNLGRYKARFERELDGLGDIEEVYIVCEFSLEELMAYPKGSNLPKYRKRQVRVRGPYMYKQLKIYEEKYNLTVIFCSDSLEASDTSIEILKRVYDGV